jgi:hypothetical protein
VLFAHRRLKQQEAPNRRGAPHGNKEGSFPKRLLYPECASLIVLDVQIGTNQISCGTASERLESAVFRPGRWGMDPRRECLDVDPCDVTAWPDLGSMSSLIAFAPHCVTSPRRRPSRNRE